MCHQQTVDDNDEPIIFLKIFFCFLHVLTLGFNQRKKKSVCYFFYPAFDANVHVGHQIVLKKTVKSNINKEKLLEEEIKQEDKLK